MRLTVLAIPSPFPRREHFHDQRRDAEQVQAGLLCSAPTPAVAACRRQRSVAAEDHDGQHRRPQRHAARQVQEGVRSCLCHSWGAPCSRRQAGGVGVGGSRGLGREQDLLLAGPAWDWQDLPPGALHCR